MNLDLAIDPGWAVGLLLAQVRVAAFVVTAPQLGSAVPGPGRLAFVVAMSLALTSPVAQVPDVPGLIALGVVNAVVGGALGFVVGVTFQLFAVAGSLIDVTAATSIATVFDPTRGEQGAVFARLFSIAGLTLFHVAGGLALLVGTLGWSLRAVPLDGALELQPGMSTIVLDLVQMLMVAGFELALPVLGALFLIEVVLGIASRFAPTANVFLLGMPAKVGVAMVVSVTSVALFPAFMTGLLDTTERAVFDMLDAMVVRG